MEDNIKFKINANGISIEKPVQIVEKYALYSTSLGVLPGTLLSSGSLSLVVFKMLEDISEFYGVQEVDQIRLGLMSVLPGAVYHTIKTLVDTLFLSVPQLKVLSSFVSGALLASLVISITGRIAINLCEKGIKLDEVSLSDLKEEVVNLFKSGELKKEMKTAITSRFK